MGIKAVWMGLIMENPEESMKQMNKVLNKEKFQNAKLIGYWNTLSGKSGTGGRTDVMVEFNDKDICRLAIHPFHLGSGLRFSWHDDYFDNNKSIIPKEIIEKYFESEDK